MKLYIGNGLHQNVDFQYRLKKYKSYRTQVVPIGGQIQISGELEKEDVDKIILDHSTYGMVSASEFRNYKGFKIPYVYSVDQPIAFEALQELIAQNRDFNDEQGKMLRQKAALAVSQIIEDNTPNIPGIPKRQLTNLEMSIEEIGTKDRDPTVNEGVRITRDPNFGAPQGPQPVKQRGSLF